MIEIDESFVDASAPNANAIKNGRGLALKGKFVSLHQTNDGSLLFGECAGSGKSNYACSCDFQDPAQPVHRCSCPSRQFPCKHCLGLMYAFVGGKEFTEAEAPADVVEKREKADKRAVKKKERSATPKKVNVAALKKKIGAQLQGIDLLESLVSDLVRSGLGNMDAKRGAEVVGRAKRLGDAYLPGAQSALNRFAGIFEEEPGRASASAGSKPVSEGILTEAFDQLIRLHSLAKRGRAYLKARLDDPKLKPETDSEIAGLLGHAWQLAELREAGLVEGDAELLQLAFNSYDDTARREYVDTGIWLNLKTGRVPVTQTFRPYRAAKFIKGEDSFFQIATVPELCVYPGDLNPRVRWDAMVPRPTVSADFKTVQKHAASDFAAAIKAVRGQLKSPLADKQLVMLLHYARIGMLSAESEEDEGLWVAEDGGGNRIALSDVTRTAEPPSCHLLGMLPADLLENQALLVRFHHDLEEGVLQAKPLSIVTGDRVIRLTY